MCTDATGISAKYTITNNVCVADRTTTTAATSVCKSGQTGVLNAGESLKQGVKLISCNSLYYLILQTDGNLVEYNSANVALWTSFQGPIGLKGSGSQTQNALVVPGRYGSFTAGDLASMTSAGSLVLSKSGTPVWSSQTNGFGKYLTIQDDGNLVIYSSANQPVWAVGLPK